MTTRTPDEEIDFLRELPLTAGGSAFAAADLVDCSRCERKNPPSRSDCLYCGAKLDARAVRVDNIPSIREPEIWERGHNVIVLSSADADLLSASALTGREVQFLESVARARQPIPIMRVPSSEEAEFVLRQLSTSGMKCLNVSDEQLGAERSPRRLRRIGMSGEGSLRLTLFNGGEEIDIPAVDIVLIVTGLLRRLETATTAKREKGSYKFIEESRSSTDEVVIDLYRRGEPQGFRIVCSGFDFSGLGDEMSATAAANIIKLTGKLAAACPNARIVESFREVAGLLATVWPESLSKNFAGPRRAGLIKRGFGRVEISDNTEQFTRFSRMHFHLL